LGFGATLAFAACAPRASGFARSADRFNWTVRPPEEAGMSRAGIDGIRVALQKLINDGLITGVVSAVARHNKLVWYEAQGFRDPNARVPMPIDGIFRMMSSTKPVTAVAALLMIQEGKLSLDDKVSRFIPSWKNQKVAIAPPGTKDPAQVKLVPLQREVTLRDLLTHTSGITAIGLGGDGPGSLVNKIKLDTSETLAEYIPKLGNAALDFQPGSKFSYSLTEGPDTVLRLVEIVSGQTADVFLRERLFQPLDMRDTYFNVPPEKQDRVVDVYGKADGEWHAVPETMGPRPWKYFSGGGGLFSTAHDFLNFELLLLNKGSFNGHRVLKPEMIDLMTSDQAGPQFRAWLPPFTTAFNFGLLVSVVRDANNMTGRSVGAFGWGGAHGTETWAEPALDLAAVYFVQLSPPPQSGAPAFEKAIKAAIVS
jgi:CubicO group peptidase (beta-lactamase class C family)